MLKEEAVFDTITVWGHDRLPAADDNFVKGLEEWISFAEAVCISFHECIPMPDLLTDSDQPHSRS
jgi:Ribonuclease H2 non-catalytic subunit (Ylr154p-like)